MNTLLRFYALLGFCCTAASAAFDPVDSSIFATLLDAPELVDADNHLLQINYNLSADLDDTCKVLEFQVATGDTTDWEVVPLRLLVENGYKTNGNNSFKWYYKYTVHNGDTVVMFLRFRLGNKDACEKGWRTREPMPRSRWRMETGVINGKLYVVGGGTDPASHVNWVESYDPVTDSWTEKAPLLTPRDAAGVAVINDTLYAVGGYNGGYDFKKTMEYYDPDADAWTAGASMRYGRSAAAAVAVDGKLYVIGGTFQVGSTIIIRDSVEVYDPATKAWAVKSSMPTPRVKGAVAAYGGKIYVMGGSYYDDIPYIQTYYDIVEIYDPATDTWSTGASMPTKRMGMATAVLDGKIYVMGGHCDTLWTYPSPTYAIRLDDVEVYDPETDEWTTGSPLPTARTNAAAGVIDGTVYVVGGQQNGEAYDPASYLAVNEAFRPLPTAKHSNFLQTAAFTLDMASGIRVPEPATSGGAASADGIRIELPGYRGGPVRTVLYDVSGKPVRSAVRVTVKDGTAFLRTPGTGSGVHCFHAAYDGGETIVKLIELR